MTADEMNLEGPQSAPREGEDVTVTKDGGVLKLVKKEGTELPMIGDEVSVHYVGMLLDGTQFNSSRHRENPFSFELGKRLVIKTLDIGVATMKLVELCQLICKVCRVCICICKQPTQDTPKCYTCI